MTVRAKIIVKEEITVEIPNGSARAVVVNGEAGEYRLLIDNSMVRFRNKEHLKKARCAIGALLEAVERAEARFDWDQIPYIEEGGVRVV